MRHAGRIHASAPTAAAAAARAQASRAPAPAARMLAAAALAAVLAAAVLAGCTASTRRPVPAQSGHPVTAPGRAASGLAGAQQIPGLAALTGRGGITDLTALSCAAPGSCTAAGSYQTASAPNDQVPLAVTEAGGTWQRASDLPGMAFFAHGAAALEAVSCAQPGDCTAVGSYTTAAGYEQLFAIVQAGGAWQLPANVPGITALNKGGLARVNALSCPSPGNCSAGGSYNDASDNDNTQAFVVTETGGRWQPAQEVPGTAALNTGKAASVNAVSCTPGGCTAAGSDAPAPGASATFVTSEADGSWSQAAQLPGGAAFSPGGAGEVNAVSCTSPGNCTAGGDYFPDLDRRQAFLASQVAGRWQPAQAVPGTSSGPASRGFLGTGGTSEVTFVSCPAAGSCTAAGTYTDRRGRQQAFAASQVAGTWQRAAQLPGTAALSGGRAVDLTALSCAAPGRCAAGGSYTDRNGYQQAFLARQVSGRWQPAAQVPGTIARSAGAGSAVNAVACVPAGSCTAAGYSGSGRGQDAFALSGI